jgi:MOSC domain-containing protein YiiM
LRVVSVNVARPRELRWGERVIRTAILKAPVAGRVRVGRLNLEGDGQSDLKAHGGESMAVYGYAGEHYDFWAAELDRDDLTFGMAGENLTISGLLETDVRVGDTFAVGSCVLQATQPRIPCYKLDAAFALDGMVERFREAHRYGVHFRVLEEGDVGAGDDFRRVARAEASYTIEQVGRLHGGFASDPEAVRALAELETLGPRARRKFGLLRDAAG